MGILQRNIIEYDFINMQTIVSKIQKVELYLTGLIIRRLCTP